MMLHETPLLRTLFACDTLQELPEGKLESLLEEHPYFAHARWFQAARNLPDKSFLIARHQAAVYCYDPLKFSWVQEQLHVSPVDASGIESQTLPEGSPFEDEWISEEYDLMNRSAESDEGSGEALTAGSQAAGNEDELGASPALQETSIEPDQAHSLADRQTDSESFSQDIPEEADSGTEENGSAAPAETGFRGSTRLEAATDAPAEPTTAFMEVQEAPISEKNAPVQHPPQEELMNLAAEVHESEKAVETAVESRLTESIRDASEDLAEQTPASELAAEPPMETRLQETAPELSVQDPGPELPPPDCGTSGRERSEAVRENREPDPVFQPLFTQDYFAFTGTRVPSELPNDKPPTMAQLRSFTDWLRSMKRPAGARDPDLLHDDAAETGRQDPGQRELIEIAEQSNRIDQEVLTEAMAEVRLSQGQQDKALEIYEKLGLLYPEKKSYFAQKIEQILNSQ